MERLTHSTRPLLDRVQQRFVRSRPGSVLILVVALLVLMALIGTAYITMAQSDRYASQQHQYNTQIDLLVDSVVNLTKAVIRQDLFANNQFRPAGTTYRHYVGVGPDTIAMQRYPVPAIPPGYNQVLNAGTTWLADRLPVVNNISALPTAINGNNPPHWRFVTGPLTGTNFESPVWANNTQQIFTRDLPLLAGGTNARLVPTVYQTVGGQTVPAFLMMDVNGNVRADLGYIIAADADGDGIPDSCLFRLPVGSINGLTYYAGVRIVDNLAAINVNTAGAPQPPPVGAYAPTVPPGDFFPSNVDLASLLINSGSTPDNPNGINALNFYRFGSTAGPRASSTGTTLRTVFDDNGNGRQDFQFGTPYEAAWMQLGRRLQNPGVGQNSANSLIRYTALGLADSMKLAYKFILRDPALAPSTVEQDLFNSTNSQNFVSDQPYLPQNAAEWFRANFLFNPNINQPNNVPLRSILVTRNPVSSFVPSKFRLRAPTLPDQYGNGYVYGDIVPFTVAQGNTRGFVYLGPTPIFPATFNTSPPGPFNPLGHWYWAVEPWSTSPTKISVNTGTFDQLRSAYWSVINDPTATVLVGTQVLPTSVPPNTQFRQFYSPLRDPNETMAAAAFRNQRPPARTYLPPPETAKLRAALAAVNTMGLRQGNTVALGNTFNIISRKIILGAFVPPGAPNAAPPANFLLSNRLVEATVYSTAPQPYITRVYAENDSANVNPTNDNKPPNPKGYVGIELYNPYPFDISLKNWNLAILQGRTASAAPPSPNPTMGLYPNMWLKAITGFTGFTTGTGSTATTAVIPGGPQGGYLILENYSDTGATVSPNDAQHRPSIMDPAVGGGTVPPNLKYFYVPGLQQVMQDPADPTIPGGELVLLRPRQSVLQAGGLNNVPFTLVSNTLATTLEYNENQLYDLVPVDSFDFSGMTQVPQNGTMFTGMYYHRFQDPNNNWKFVYPGHWDATGTLPGGPAAPFHQEGEKVVTWPNPGGTNVAIQPSVQVFGTPGISTFPNNFPAIQLNNVDCAGPLAPGPNPAQKYFPYGAFARNGDILQVPYIGAYRLRLLSSPGGIPTPDATVQPALADPLRPFEMLELNPVTMDAQQADDYDTYSQPPTTSDDQAENIGRFCPIAATDVPANCPANDFLGPPANPLVNNPAPRWTYHWTMQLLDYLTVDSPQDAQLCTMPPDDYVAAPTSSQSTPPQGINHTSSTSPPPQVYGIVLTGGNFTQITANIDLSFAAQANYGTPLIQFLTGNAQGQILKVTGMARSGPLNQWRITFGPAFGAPLIPALLAPRQGDVFVILAAPEETAPTDGLVNVNTASWRVLAAVPFVPNLGNFSNPPLRAQAALLNAKIALSIVVYRDINDGSGANPPHGHGPFATLDELNAVPMLANYPPYTQVNPFYTVRDAMYGANSAQTRDFNTSDGDLSPFNPTGGSGDGVKGDFEGTFLMMNRVSNMLTTRSDSFTVYLVVQGWRDAQTPNPTLAVQRRAAFLVDRSVVTPVNPSATFTPVPTD